VPSIKAKLQLKTGLTFLIEEAKKTPVLRNHSAILSTWKDLHPELKARAILKPFEAEPMKNRIMEFLRGD
jgi:hypothetical protein